MSPTQNTFQTQKEPLVIQRGSMQQLYDSEGNKYIDCIASNLTYSVGVCHPAINERLKVQLELLPHLSSMYYNDLVSELTKKIIDRLPPRSDKKKWKVYQCVSGSEAIDMAVHLARVHTKTNTILALENSQHGAVGVPMGLSGTFNCKQDLPSNAGIIHLPAPIQDQKSNVSTLLDISERIIKSSTPQQIGAFIQETIMGQGGVHVIPQEYLRGMQTLTKKYGGLYISDEIQSGLGRNGKSFFAFQHTGIEPDIITLGKGIGNGQPISVVIATEDIFESLLRTNRFVFHTQACNLMSVTSAIGVMNIIDDKYISQIEAKGLLIDKLAKTAINAKQVEDIRGMGLFRGVELEQKVAYQCQEQMRYKGVLMGFGLGKGGVKKTLRFMPPFCLEEKDITLIFEKLVSILDKI